MLVERGDSQYNFDREPDLRTIAYFGQSLVGNNYTSCLASRNATNGLA